MHVSTSIDKNLCCFRETVVILCAHTGAIRARAIYDQNITDTCLTQQPFIQRLWLAWFGCHKIAGFAAMADNHCTFHFCTHIFTVSRPGEKSHRMDSTVKRGTQHVSHSCVELQENMSRVTTSRYLILYGGNERSRHGNQKCSRLDFQLELPSILGGEFLKRFLHRFSNFNQIGGRLSRITSDLVASTKIQRHNIREHFTERKRNSCSLLPDGGVATRTNVGMDALYIQSIFLYNFWNGTVRHKIFPDAK
mmetsp:Transcript_12762/g.19278  ORF Transcript_12762/g.19278 Transcript_12762/m.19278 type:complete len:250 (-) Transcript_12762:658-1407(-)